MSQSDQQHYDDPDDEFDPEDPGSFEEGMATQRKLLEAKLAKAGSLKVPPSTARQLAEIGRKHSALDLSKVAGTSALVNFKLDPALTRKLAPGGILGPEARKKIADMMPAYERTRPVPLVPLKPPVTPVKVIETVAAPQPEPPKLKWWQEPHWMFAASVWTIVTGPLAVATFLILVL